MNTLRALLDRVGRKTWLTGIVAFVGLAILSVSWAVATPLSASPDEPAHIVKAAAVVRGELIGAPTNRPGFTSVTIPSYVGNAVGLDVPRLSSGATPRTARSSAVTRRHARS